MSGAAITVSIDDQEVQDLLDRIRKNLGDLRPAMKIIGSIVRASIIRNFEKGGRPNKWAKHSETTKKRRGKDGKVLMVQGLAGGLAASINYRADHESVTVGTNKVYGAVHQFGAEKGSFGEFVFNVREHLRKGRKVKAHTRKAKLPWGDIPARPFLMVQDEDWAEMREALNEYITQAR